MRIIYSFYKESGFWIVTCPSDKSIKESTYSLLIEAINAFFTTHKNIEYFDIVIPLSKPTPIHITPVFQIRKKRHNRVIPVMEIMKRLYQNTHQSLL